MTSGTGSSASQSSSLSNSLRSTPRCPSSIEIIRSPSSFGSVEIERLANALMTRGESHQPIQEARRVPEERQALLQVDADAAKQHLIAADVDLVGGRRRVERQQRDLVAARQQLDRQRVVARAAAAVHPRGAGGDREDLHDADGCAADREGLPAHRTICISELRGLERARAEQEVDEVAFVRLQPVQADRRDRPDVQAVDVRGVESAGAGASGVVGDRRADQRRPDRLQHLVLRALRPPSTNGNMYSFLRRGGVRRVAVHTVGSR